MNGNRIHVYFFITMKQGFFSNPVLEKPLWKISRKFKSSTTFSASFNLFSMDFITSVTPALHTTPAFYNCDFVKKLSKMESSNDTLWKIFMKNLDRHPENTAVEDGPITCSYKQLYKIVTSTAHSLELGSSRNPFVVSLLPAGLKYIVSSLATLSVNKIVVVIHDTYTSTQVQKCLQALQHPTVVTSQEKWDKIQNGFGGKYPHLRILTDDFLQSDFKNGVTHHKEESTSDSTLEGVSYCLFTSGSTGTPKAVLIRDSSIVNGIRGLVGLDPQVFTSSVRGLMGVTNSFIPSLTDIWTIFESGGTLVIPSAEIKRDIDRYRSWITENRIIAATFATPVFEMIVAKDVDKLTSLRWVTFGGARMNPQRIRLDGAKFKLYHIYGSTEMFICAQCEVTEETGVIPTRVGLPLPGCKIYVLDDRGHEVTTPEFRGHIYFAGAGVMRGYYGQPELTSQVLATNPFDLDMTPMYNTGDCGYWSANGELHITGRKDEQIKVHGMRLELGEVETALCKFWAIKEAVVISKENGGNTHIFGFCTLITGQEEPNSKILDEFLTQHLQPHAIPRSIKFLDEMPTTPSGKTDRMKLRENFTFFAGKSSVDDEISEESDWTRTVRSVWAEVLQIPTNQISPRDNFFYIGGNSVATFAVMQKLRMIDPNLRRVDTLLLFSFPVLKDFAHALLQDQFSSGDAKVKLNDFKNEIALPMDFPARISQPAILITGTTGFFGFLLLLDALKAYPETEIFTIVRAKNDEEAGKRILKKTEQNSLENFKNGLQRVNCLAGDLAKPKFGLENAVYSKLMSSVNVIFHSAAEVSFMKTYEQLKETTVEMTKNVLQFSAEGCSKQLHFMSTIGVFDGVEDKSPGTYEAAEDRIPLEVNPQKMINGYHQSKWVSEQLVWAAADRGLAASIYRIGQVGGHRATKIVDRSDAIACFLCACVKMNCFPIAELRLPFVDGDISETIVQLSKKPSSCASTPTVFHMVGADVGFENFFGRENNLKQVSFDEWESEFLKSVGHEPRSEDEINAWLFLQMLKHAEQQVAAKQKSLMKNVTFQVKKTVEMAGENFRKVNPQFYLDLLLSQAKDK